MADLDWGAAVDSQEQTLTTQVSSPTGKGKGRGYHVATSQM